MLTKLRIIFTILSALCIAAAIPLGMFFDLPAVILCILGAIVFFGLMLICKKRAGVKEEQETPPSTKKQDE